MPGSKRTAHAGNAPASPALERAMAADGNETCSASYQVPPTKGGHAANCGTLPPFCTAESPRRRRAGESMTTFLTYTILGLVLGAVYSIAASGLVLTYNTSGIFNFAHGAQAMFGTFLYWQFQQ